MTLLGALRRSIGDGIPSLNNPGLPLTSSVLVDVLGGRSHTDAGVNVTETSALAMPAVWRALNLLSSTPAALPWDVFRRGDESRQPLATGNAADVLANPHPDMTPFEWKELMFARRHAHGNAYAQILLNGLGQVSELWPLDPMKMQVGRARDHSKWYSYDGFPLRSDQVLHIPGFGYDGITGASPIRVAARQGVGLALAAESYGGRLFANGTLMSGVLQTEQRLDEDQAESLQKRWTAMNSGMSNAHRVGVLDAGASFKALTLSPQDTQFLESRRFQVIEIARIFGLPPWMLSDVDKSTSWGTGIEQQGIGFVTYTLRPDLVRFEERLTQLLGPSTQYVKFNVNGLLRGDVKTRFAAYAMGRQWGWYSINDIRRLEDLAPIEGGDVYLSPINMADATKPVDLAAGDESSLQDQIDEIKAAMAA